MILLAFFFIVLYNKDVLLGGVIEIMKKALIVGANGFVGNYLIQEFLSNGDNVLASDIQKQKAFNSNVPYIDIDILDKKRVEEVIQKYQPDYLVNLAAISSVGLSWTIPEKTMQINVEGSLNLLESVKKFCPKCKILLIGSAEEYESKNRPLKEEDSINANNPYAISKIAQENFAKLYKEKYGLNIVCTRSFNHTGIGQSDQFVIPSFCKQVAEIDKSGRPGKIYVGNLSAYRDFSDVRDIVKVYRALLENDTPELIYNVGSGKAYKIEQLLNYIISLSSQKIEVVVDKEKFRPIDIPYTCCDNSKTIQYFNNTDIKETIKGIYENFRNRNIKRELEDDER